MDIADIPVRDIVVDERFNCRGYVQPVDVEGLADDIKAHGLIMPLAVCKNEQGTYNLIAGFRRFKALTLYLKWESVPCNVLAADPRRAKLINIVENLQREQLLPSQEASALSELHVAYKMTVSEIARHLGQSYSWVDVRVKLSKLPRNVQDEVDSKTFKLSDVQSIFEAYMKHDTKTFYDSLRALLEKRERAELEKLTIIKEKPKRLKVEELKTKNLSEIMFIQDIIGQSEVEHPCNKALAWCAGRATTAEFLFYLMNDGIVVPNDVKEDYNLC